jgi:hypothetical protein
VPVGSADVAFANIVAAFQDCKRGNYARVIMINPLHPDLPKIPIFVSATCNMFDNAAVRFQWEVPFVMKTVLVRSLDREWAMHPTVILVVANSSLRT